MAPKEGVKADPSPWPLSNPWLPLIVGLAAAVLAVLLHPWGGTAGILARVLVVLVALIAAGTAVSLRLHFADRERPNRDPRGPNGDPQPVWLTALESRAKSASVVALAAAVPLLALFALDEAWDSMRLFLSVLGVVGLGGAVLVLLPSVARRVVVSLLVIVHFGAILTAVTSVPPPGAEAPWVSTVAWSRCFRYYLQFMYLNNAYHFYSPEPGPASLLWFHIDYSDGSERWLRIPEREQFATHQEYQRRLALTEGVNMIMPAPAVFPRQLEERRLSDGAFGPTPIPPHPDLPASVQYREPQPYSKTMLTSYARHVAYNYPSEKDPKATVEGIKIYRVVHSMMTPLQMASGVRPTDPVLYMPYYQGEFDKDGKLKDPNDPLLYWLIPIMWQPKNMEQLHPIQVPHTGSPGGDDWEKVDYTQKHAGMKKTRKAQP